MMNDTEFENILKQALRPDISDEEILIKETPSKSKRRKSTMRKHRIIQSAVGALDIKLLNRKKHRTQPSQIPLL